MVKDSKKFHSKKKIEEASNYVKEHALAWYISFEDEKKMVAIYKFLISSKQHVPKASSNILVESKC